MYGLPNAPSGIIHVFRCGKSKKQHFCHFMYVQIKGVKMDMIIIFSWNFSLVIFMLFFVFRPMTSKIIQLVIDVGELFYTFMTGN